MTSTEEIFIQECPAWARRLGIPDYRLWCICKELASYDSMMRFYVLNMHYWKHEISWSERTLLQSVLKAWEEMADSYDH